ncbi:hypothetical protein OHA88_15950 [Streptomyces sp. NBC_00353]|uniref:hypothetical protein n=1 Tax=Streptomyces sp. NBC_00353 TaxID=2975722 RepID=UPI002E258E63
MSRRRKFLEELRAALPSGETGARPVPGDFDIPEPDHPPRYRVLPGPGVREFCTGPGAAGYQDALRLLSPDALEYSWVGRTGDGSFPSPAPGHRTLVERATGVARYPIGVRGLVRAAGIGYIRTSSTGWYASAGARMRAPRGPAGSAHRQRGEVSSS